MSGEHLLMMGGGDPLDELMRIGRSVRFRREVSPVLTRTPGVAGSTTTWTFSCWLKLAAVAGSNVFGLFVNHGDGASYRDLLEIQNDQIRFDINSQASAWAGQLKTNALFRDVAGWAHLVAVFDSTNATAGDRMRLYVNGIRITSFAAQANPAQGAASWTNQAGIVHRLGADLFAGTASHHNGYLAETNFVDGQALDPTAFGTIHPATGQWRPKPYAGPYGTNGFHLDFSDGSAATAAALGKDRSGNNNDWTPTNISVTAGVTQDWLLDTPTNNFPISNSEQTSNSGGTGTITAGGLTATLNTTAAWVAPTILPRSGKWYFEVTMGAGVSASTTMVDVGICGINDAVDFTSAATYVSNGQKCVDVTLSGFGSTFSSTGSPVIGCAVDIDTKTVEFIKDGVSQGSFAWSGIYDDLAMAVANRGTTAGSRVVHLNYGQRSFAYAPPAGFNELCTKNLRFPSIREPKKHFDIVLRAGTGTAQSDTGLAFQPDLAWIKSRSLASNHALYDSVRGVQKRLESNTTAAQVAADAGVTAFSSDGITVGALAQVNSNGAAYVDWLWKAGGAAVADNSGSIASQVSANRQAGFSVVAYTGTGAAGTVGHGLGATPKLIIVKKVNSAASGSWVVQHAAGVQAGYPNPGQNYVLLNGTQGGNASALPWNNTNPTADVFSIGTDAALNTVGDAFIAYCFAEVPGFSKFGSYIGNGAGAGPFVNCGFRPRWVLVKNFSATSEWQLIDTARSPYNAAVSALEPQAAIAEDSSSNADKDLLAAGFKVRATSYNASGANYLYMAFAEFPFRYANAR